MNDINFNINSKGTRPSVQAYDGSFDGVPCEIVEAVYYIATHILWGAAQSFSSPNWTSSAIENYHFQMAKI